MYFLGIILIFLWYFWSILGYFLLYQGILYLKKLNFLEIWQGKIYLLSWNYSIINLGLIFLIYLTSLRNIPSRKLHFHLTIFYYLLIANSIYLGYSTFQYSEINIPFHFIQENYAGSLRLDHLMANWLYFLKNYLFPLKIFHWRIDLMLVFLNVLNFLMIILDISILDLLFRFHIGPIPKYLNFLNEVIILQFVLYILHWVHFYLSLMLVFIIIINLLKLSQNYLNLWDFLHIGKNIVIV